MIDMPSVLIKDFSQNKFEWSTVVKKAVDMKTWKSLIPYFLLDTGRIKTKNLRLQDNYFYFSKKRKKIEAILRRGNIYFY